MLKIAETCRCEILLSGVVVAIAEGVETQEDTNLAKGLNSVIPFVTSQLQHCWGGANKDKVIYNGAVEQGIDAKHAGPT